MKIYGETQREKAISLAKQIMTDADQNDSGAIDFTEFLVAAMNEEKLLNKHKIEQAFKMFDAVYKKKLFDDLLNSYLIFLRMAMDL